MGRASWVYSESASPAPWCVMLECVGASAIDGIFVDIIIYSEELPAGQIEVYSICSNNSAHMAAYIEHIIRKNGLSFTVYDYQALYLTLKEFFKDKGAIDHD